MGKVPLGFVQMVDDNINNIPEGSSSDAPVHNPEDEQPQEPVEPQEPASQEDANLDDLVNQTVVEPPLTTPKEPVDESISDKKRVVVIDDHADTIAIIEKSLRAKFDVSSFNNANEALESLFITSTDIIIVDLLMPGMNGVEFIKRLRESFESNEREIPPIIITTANENIIPPELNSVTQGLNISLVTKPFLIPDLTRRIEREIRRSEGFTESILNLLDDSNFLDVSGMNVVGSHFRDDYHRLEHACNHLMTDVVIYLERLNRSSSNLTFYQTRAAHSFGYLKTIISGLPTSKLKDFHVFKFITRKGGSSISEKGVRWFVKKSDAGYWFIRNIYNRKGISHEVIDQIRAITSKHFYEQHKGRFNVPYRLPSPLREFECTWSIEEAIMGPDLGYVFEKIKSELYSESKNTQKYRLLQSIRNELINKCLENIKFWQEKAPHITHEDVSRDTKQIETYFKSHISRIIKIEPVRTGIVFLDEEKTLWELCNELFNESNLGLDKKTVVRSLDASPMNVILKMKDQDQGVEKLNPSIDNIINALTDGNGNVSKKALTQRLYHVDHGFVYSHYLEDLFHLVDSFESDDTSIMVNQQIDHNLSIYNGFVRRGSGNLPPNKGAFFLMGFYRNIRKLFLTITEYHENNLTAFHSEREDKRIKEWKFNTDKRKYEEAIRHHARMASAYLEYAIERYKRNVKILHNKRYKSITVSSINAREKLEILLQNKDSSNIEIGNFISDIKNMIERDRQTFYTRKYLLNSMYTGMCKILSRLTSRFENIKLPSYIGDK